MPDDRTTQGGNYWTLFTPGIWKLLHAVLHPSVIFRKMTNGFRPKWGAQTYAVFRSVVSTAKPHKRSVLDELRRVPEVASTREMIKEVG